MGASKHQVSIKLNRFKINNDSIFVNSIIIPVVIFFVVFIYYPFFMNFIYMFTDYNYLNTPSFVGLKNILKFFTDEIALQAFKNTFIITLVSAPVVMVLSLLISVLVYNMRIGKSLIRSMIFSTYLISLVVAAIIFKNWFASESGMINGFIQSMGMEKVPWLTEPAWAMVAIIALGVWKYLGYYVVIFLAGLSNIKSELYEASKIDGANSVETLFYITIPQLSPTIVFSMIISAITFLKTYSQVVTLTNGGPYRSTQTVLMYMFDQGFSSRNVGYASVISVAMVIAVLVITLIQMKATKFFSDEGV